MATREDDDDEINPFTTVLNDQDHHEQQPNSLTTVHDGAPEQQSYSLRSIESTVLIRQLPSEGLSFQLWPAATALISLLDSYRSSPSTSPLSAAFSGSQRQLRILELGSGTGIVGIVAAATLGGNVTITDLPHVVPNLQFNTDANKEVVTSNGGAVTVAALRWGNVDDVAEIGRDFDVVLASDVVYHDHLYEPLLETLRFLLLGFEEEKEMKKKKKKKKKKEKEKVFVMAHLKRWKKESAFFKKAKKLFDVDVLHTCAPSDRARVGVVVYRFVPKGLIAPSEV
ncbi:uncharacterized protein LOC130941154 [Arachis stenosperma]|uniref:uncharacterized protein LOC130941154 n=1 Tax=Arachis stenosperma TaxID=217475 RepID=UPI0025AB788E|nr:uncharacterized protein LOC130941154 [Arachis stenosperma]